MKNWKLILIGGFFVFILFKVFVINPLEESKQRQTPSTAITVSEDASGEVTMVDQDGRAVSMNEIMSWKPEVDIKQELINDEDN